MQRGVAALALALSCTDATGQQLPTWFTAGAMDSISQQLPGYASMTAADLVDAAEGAALDAAGSLVGGLPVPPEVASAVEQVGGRCRCRCPGGCCCRQGCSGRQPGMPIIVVLLLIAGRGWSAEGHSRPDPWHC
jgi:hypothetical protein